MLMSDVRASKKQEEEIEVRNIVVRDGRYAQRRMRDEQKFLATNLKFFDRKKKCGKK